MRKHARSTPEVIRVVDRTYQIMRREVDRVEYSLQALRDRQRTLDDGNEPLQSIADDALMTLVNAASLLGGQADMLRSFATQTAVEGLNDQPEPEEP